MFKNLSPDDISKKSFKTFKNFSFDNNDSGSGIFLIKARSGSRYNYVSGSDVVTPITSGVITTNYFAYPSYAMLHQLYYSKHGKVYINTGSAHRELHTSASIVSIARDVIGEKVKPGSIELDVTIGGQLFEIRDDSEGTLYDNAHSASFAAFKSSSFDRSQGVLANGSGSDVGNIFYEQGLVVLTDTGSYTTDISSWTLKHKSTQIHYEYEYRVKIQPSEFNTSTNISLTPGRSGSQTITEGVVSMSNYFPPSDKPSGHGTGSYARFYNAATESLGFVTESTFRPYVTDIGLYGENGELLVHGKLGKPVKLSDDFNTTFVVRFDV